MLNIIILSKNRACQLDLLLRSLIDNIKLEYVISCLYLTTNEKFYDGYEILKDKYRAINFVLQTGSFKPHLLSCFTTVKPYTLILVDDIILIDKIEYDDTFKLFENSTDIIDINLRMGSNLKRINFEDKVNIPSVNIDHLGRYVWVNGDHRINPYWNHVLTTCGNICKSEFLYNLISKLNFNNPNEMEDHIVRNTPDIKYALCYSKNKLIEFNVNCVNTTHRTNVHGNCSADFLNDIWLSGKQIELEPLYNLSRECQRFPNIEFKYENR